MPTTLNEAVRFSTDAELEIGRLARKLKKSESDVQSDIIDFIERGSNSRTARSRITVSRSDVVAFEISRSVFDYGIFYYDLDSENFLQIEADTPGAPSDVEGEDDFDADKDEDADSDEREAEAAEADGEREDQEDEADPDEDAIAASEGHSEASALRQKHGAIVTKTVTFSDGRVETVRMQPLARYYQMLPRAAIIDHVNEIWETRASPIVHSALEQNKRGPDLGRAIAGSLTALFDQLRVETCLRDVEINRLQKAMLEHAIRTAPSSATTHTQIKDEFDIVVRKAISNALRDRPEKSNIFDYIYRDTSRVATPSEYAQIDSGVGDKITVTASQVARMTNALESMMSRHNVKFAPTTKAARLLRQSRGGSTSPAGFRSNLSDLESGSTIGSYSDIAMMRGRDEYSPERIAGKMGPLRADEEDQMIASIDAAKEKTSFETSPTLDTRKINSSGDYVPHSAVRLKIRSGDTTETIHNHIRDLEDLGEEAQESTPAHHILAEIKHVVESVLMNSTSLDTLATEHNFVEICREKIRDQVEFLSGLLEYLAMSGLDVAPESGRQSEGSTTRQEIIDLSRRAHRAALLMTDGIVQTDILRDNRRPKAIVQNKIDELDRELENTRNKATQDKNVNSDMQLIERDISALKLELKSTTSLYFDLIKKIRSALALVDAIALLRKCESYLPAVKSDEELPSKRRVSRYNIQLAATRAKRLKRTETAQKRAIYSKISASDDSPAVASLAIEGATERYERQVDETMRKLVSNNEIQFHPLNPIDTIVSICVQHRIGMNPRAEDIRGAFTFTAALPRRFDKLGLKVSRHYTVMGQATDKENQRDPNMRVSYTGTQGKVDEIVVPRSQIRVAASVTNEAASIAAAREKFASQLRYSALAAFRNISAQLSRAGDESAPVMPDLSESDPLLPQIARFLYQSDIASCDRLYKKGIDGIRRSVIDAGIDESVAPDPNADSPINDRLTFCMTIVAEASRRLGSGRKFADLVRQSFGGSSSDTTGATFVNRISLVAAGTVKNDPELDRASSVVDDLVELGEGVGRTQQQSLQPFIGSVSESMSLIVRSRENRAKVGEARAAKKYEDSLIGLEIPIPARVLIVPGSTLVVVPPRRSLGRVGREHIQTLGINPSMLLSDPMMGFVAAIEYAGYSRGLMPTLAYLSETLSDDFAERIMAASQVGKRMPDGSVKRRSLTPGEMGAVNKVAADSLRNMFISPVSPNNEDLKSAERQAVLKTYRKINKILDSNEIGVMSPEGEWSVEATSPQVAQSIKDLKDAFLDAAAKSVISNEGAKELYKVAPCTAVMLNRLAFTSSETMLFDILTPTSETALQTMTADFYNEAMSGIQRSKTGREVIFSREVDRIAVAMRVLNDFYTALMADTERESAGKIVVARLVKKFAGEDGVDPAKRGEILKRVASALGASDSAPLEVLENLGSEAAEKIFAEMSTLSDNSKNNRIVGAVTRIVSDSFGTNKQQIFARAGAEKQTVACANTVREWIQGLSPISSHAVQDIVDQTPANVVRYGTPQLINKVSDDVFSAVYGRYIAESRESLRPYTPEVQR